MTSETKMLRVLGAISSGTNFKQIADSTDLDIGLVRNYGSILKARGMVVRDNPGRPNCEVATYSITADGRAHLQAQIEDDTPAIPLVQAGIASRPALARVWQGAIA